MSSAVEDRSHPFGERIAEFDDRIDQLLERIRGHPVADTVFTTASHLADWSLIWHFTGAARTLAGAPAAEAVQLSALLGVESLVVNQGIKRLFRRTRPTETGGASVVLDGRGRCRVTAVRAHPPRVGHPRRCRRRRRPGRHRRRGPRRARPLTSSIPRLLDPEYAAVGRRLYEL